MDIMGLKEEIVRISKKCYDRHLICATGGNISCRVPGEDAILIKGSGSSFADLTVDDIVMIDLDGSHIAGDAEKSKEWQFHAGIYKVRPDVEVVIHVHPPYATAVAAKHQELPLVTNHAKGYLKYVPTIETASSGSEKLADYVVEKFENPEIVSILMKEHGSVTAGKSFNQAFYLTEMLEDTAKIVVYSK